MNEQRSPMHANHLFIHSTVMHRMQNTAKTGKSFQVSPHTQIYINIHRTAIDNSVSLERLKRRDATGYT